MGCIIFHFLLNCPRGVFFSAVVPLPPIIGGTGVRVKTHTGKNSTNSIMTLSVINQVSFKAESSPTNITFVRLKSSVCPHVSGQVTFLRKSCSTDTASVRFLSTVNSHVCGQVTFLGKIFITEIANVRFFPTVCPNV